MQQEPPDRPRDGAAERNFGRATRVAREGRSWSQRRLATELANHGLKLDPSAITRIENGQRAVRLGEAATIAAVLEMPLADMAAFDDDPKELSDRYYNQTLTYMVQARRSLVMAMRTIDRLIETSRRLDQRPPGRTAAHYSLDRRIQRLVKRAQAHFRGVDELVGKMWVTIDDVEDMVAKEKVLDVVIKDLLPTGDVRATAP
jgi:transcriptional regulator with XRE-family HTH domain